MKQRFIQLTLLLSFCCFVGQPGYGQGYLKVSGKKVVDQQGKNILLRGMGLGGWMLQEPYMLQLSGAAVNQGDIRGKITALIGQEKTTLFYDAWLKNHCTKADIDSMKAWGFNSVRLPMHYNLYTLPLEKEPVIGKQTWLKKGFDMTDSLLSWCKANQMYLILDLHAAPGGQGADNAISDRDSTRPSLWQSEGNQQKTIALWQKLAERYANERWIGGYDIINETNWGFQSSNDKNGCAESENGPLRKMLMAITAAIRQVDKNHIIFLEGNCWANNYKGVFPLWDNNLVVSFHKYWNENTQASIQQFIDLREQHNVPVWMGESGENSNAWFRSAIALLERHNIGWAWWPLKKLGMNNPLQVPTNPLYQKLVAYWKEKGERPTAEEAFKGLMQLAADSRIDRNIYHKDVVDAMFRQVQESNTIPFANHAVEKNPLIYAVHYDLGRIGDAYYTHDSANYWVSTGKRTQWNKGWAYRNDGVDIGPCSDTLTNGFQVSSITPSEWLQYSIIADKADKFLVKLRVAATKPSTIGLIVNERKLQEEFPVSPDGRWTTITLPGIALEKGINKVRVMGSSGEFSMNYLEITEEK
jgi:hypothetical protein